jgi:hypothetical protein
MIKRGKRDYENQEYKYSIILAPAQQAGWKDHTRPQHMLDSV